MKTLKEKIFDLYDHENTRFVHLAMVTLPSLLLTIQYFGDPIYHLSGFLSSLSANIIDLSSTKPAIKLINSEQFKESQLKQHFYETSEFLGQYPTFSEFYKKSVLSSLVTISVSTLFPPIGYGHLSISPIIVYNNRKSTDNLRGDLDTLVSSD